MEMFETIGKKPHIATQEEIIEQAQKEGRRLTQDEITAITAADTDPIHDGLEKNGLPIEKSYMPYKWIKLHQQTKVPIFLAEGALNCMAFEALGYDAAEIRISFLSALEDDLKAYPPERPIVIALSTIGDGKKAEKVYDRLKACRLEVYKIDPYGTYGSAVKALEENSESFYKTVKLIVSDPRKAEYLEKSAGSYLDTFLNEIRQSAEYPPISTGFMKLDRDLGGGLRAGLIICMAPANIGKSALMLQLADHIAERSKHDVLYVTIEMNRSDHIARSLSRLTFEESQRSSGGTPESGGKTVYEILDIKNYDRYSAREKDIISRAIKRYRGYANHIYFLEGSKITVDLIRQTVQTHTEITGSAPVVIVDYLQILAQSDPRADVRSATDYNVTELVNIAKKYRVPVVAISSINRASYKGKMSLGSAKESSGIEYGSDILLALQFQNQSDKTDMDEEKKKYPRDMELRILKNRNGSSTGVTGLKYRPKYNHFTEC